MAWKPKFAGAVLLSLSCLPLAAATLGPVTADTTLWRLALQARPDEQVSMQQVIYALWQHNPRAFRDHNLHYLLKGAVLSIPSREQMLATAPQVAYQWYQAQITQQQLPSSLPSVLMAQKSSTPTEQPTKTDTTASTVAKAVPDVTSSKAVVPVAPVANAPVTSSVAQAEAAQPVIAPVAKGSWRWQHELAWQQRLFAQSGLAVSSKQHALLSYRGQWSYEDASRQHSVNIEPYLRWHQRDSDSHLIDFQQAYWRYVAEQWELKAGIDTVFWGVTESQHLVDVINQTDVTAGVALEAKLGQPMLALRRTLGRGTVDLYLMPLFRERLFPSPAGRLAPPLPVNDDIAWYESSNGKHNLDVAVRVSQRFDAVDLGLSFFSGNNREPLLQPLLNGEIQPRYYQMEQYGLDLLWVQGDWLWKLESIYRRLGIDEYVAATGGFEFSQYGIFQQVWDLGWIAEYQYDSRGKLASLPGQNDVFVGWRLALNDVAGTTFLLGLLQDLDNSQSRSVKLEGSLRLADNLRLSVDAWLFDSEQMTDALYWLRRDDYLSLQLTYYF